MEFVVVDPSGKWMATVDRRENEDQFSAEVHLKIWGWTSKTWVLNTRIDHPHDWKDVVAILFSPDCRRNDSALLMTAGLDGNIKTWCPKTLKTKDGKVEGMSGIFSGLSRIPISSLPDFWISRACFSLRSETPTAACWSADGSLLAVSSSRQVALYNPDSNLQLSSLASPDLRRIDKICFVGDGGRYLIAGGKQSIIAWDLIAKRGMPSRFSVIHVV